MAVVIAFVILFGIMISTGVISTIAAFISGAAVTGGVIMVKVVIHL